MMGRISHQSVIYFHKSDKIALGSSYKTPKRGKIHEIP